MHTWCSIVSSPHLRDKVPKKAVRPWSTWPFDLKLAEARSWLPAEQRDHRSLTKSWTNSDGGIFWIYIHP